MKVIIDDFDGERPLHVGTDRQGVSLEAIMWRLELAKQAVITAALAPAQNAVQPVSAAALRKLPGMNGQS